MKNRLRNVLIGVLSVAVVVTLVVAMVHSHNQKCESLTVNVLQSNSSHFFTEKQALQLLQNSDANPVGKRLKEISTDALRKALAQNPWFNDIQSIDIDGSHVTLTLSAASPVAMVFPQNGEPYILGNNGALLPDDSLCPQLPVISGNVTTTYAPATTVNSCREKPLAQAYLVALHLSKSPDDLAQFPQIFVNDDGQLELYSNLGGQAVLLGDASNISEKLANVRSVYANGLLYLGTDNYSYLDARFKNRIYARKSNL